MIPCRVASFFKTYKASMFAEVTDSNGSFGACVKIVGRIEGGLVRKSLA